MIELQQLEQFVTIAKAGTISKAADILLISQPALTRSLQRLEDELGLKLFDRKKNKIMLNDNGLLALEYAEKLLDEAKSMVEKLQAYDRSKYTISIGSCAPAPNWALTYIFHQLYPEMKIVDELLYEKDKLLEGLKKDQYSLIVLDHPIDDPNLICVDLFSEHLYLSVPPAHPLAFLPQISFQDINGESVLLLSRIGFWYDLCLKEMPDSHLLVQEDETVLNELKKASAIPTFRTDITIQREQHTENRVYIPISDESAQMHFYAIYKKKNRKLFSTLSKEIQQIDWSKV